MFKNFAGMFFKNQPKTDMESEIYEQPRVIETISEKYIKDNNFIDFELPSDIKRIALVASGSSYHCAAIAANFIRNNTHLYAQAYYASEIALAGDVDVYDNTMYVFISQSGETSDTNAALNIIAAKTSKTVALTNTENSTLYNNCHFKILTFAGKENAVASTKAMCAQTFCIFLIAVKIMNDLNIDSTPILNELSCVCDSVKSVFEKRDLIKSYAKILSRYRNATVLGTGMFYPLAKEAALKIKETSYINTTAYPTGEFLHGHVAILNKKCAVISFINNGNIKFMSDVLKKIDKNYETDGLIVSADSIPDFKNKIIINLNTKSEINFLFSGLILLQLLAFETAVLKGRNVDKPKGLSKVLQ